MESIPIFNSQSVKGRNDWEKKREKKKREKMFVIGKNRKKLKEDKEMNVRVNKGNKNQVIIKTETDIEGKE